MRFTVLTATYNRAHTLEATYQSLYAQTFRDFEWVIVDDGSIDGTREMVSSWKPFFPIRYTWKPNRGKHTAINLGVEQAAGEFIAVVDSDDRLVPHALERLHNRWQQIPNPERFSSLVGLCCADDGSVFGGRLAQDYVDVFRLKDALTQIGHGDRWGITRADVFKQFRYPELNNERFVLEGLVWNRILKKYAARFFNEPLLIAGYAPNGLGRQGDLRFTSPKGAAVYHFELALSDVPPAARLKSAINAVRFSCVAVARELRLIR
ncbi:MAG TPA: glycosyltransferase family A protein [Gemmataceae bacterium]|nr:glycosyltransferase family A protein [Gemmataceae bacterium]